MSDKEQYFTYEKQQEDEFKKIESYIESGYSVYACKNKEAVFFGANKKFTGERTEFISDVDNILNHPLYNRYGDKTQVYSFHRNDDITRRSSHVQFVSRIARTIGRALRLNLDLIEAIALGHDIGHTPFGHRGESILSDLYYKNCKRYFNHNVQSARCLYYLNGKRISLQTLDGVLSHNGERTSCTYQPGELGTFDDFEKKLERCYIDKEYLKTLRPSTMEGCLVRICDILAYLGKDRQDLAKIEENDKYAKIGDSILGKSNSEILSRMCSNIIKNSMGKHYIGMDEEVFSALNKAKQDNYNAIYNDGEMTSQYDSKIRPMMEKLYDKFLETLNDDNSIIARYFVNSKMQGQYYKENKDTPPDDIVIDFISSMTDDYFIDIYEHYFGRCDLHFVPYKGLDAAGEEK